MKAPTNTETRFTAEWEPEVKFRSNGACNRTMQRKVVTKDVVRVEADQFLNMAIDRLRHGYEVRATLNGEDALRLIPITDREFRKIGIKAQTMGSFINRMSDLMVKILKRRGEKISRDAANACISDAEQKYDEFRNALVHVTPDMTVTCPECGTEFRVGKVLK